jgi:ubiquinone/menaquinone biosynthesis C-methylase UbiE
MTFDVPARVYDDYMGRYSYPLAPAFVDWAELPEGGRALDVGFGTGALTQVLIERFGPSEVAGVDPSASFVRSTSERFHLADIRHGTAEALPFDDNLFTATLAELVFHFMTDAAAGAREMVRVTRPGGVVAACVWDFVGGRAPQTRFFRAFAEVVPEVEDETERTGGRSGDLVRLLGDAGCRDVEQGELTVAVEYAGFADWWDPYTRGVAPAGQQLARLDETTRERVRERALELVGDRPFTVEATAWAARGTV